MKKNTVLVLSSSVLILSLLFPLAAAAGPAVTIMPSGSGVYLLHGSGMDGVAAMDITLRYDPSTLTNPRVEQGSLISGAMMAVNPNVPGSLRMGIIRATPLSGSGAIATIVFDRTGSSPGKLLSLTAKISNAGGGPIPVLAGIEDEQAPAGDSETSSGREQRQSTAGSGPGSDTASGTGYPLMTGAVVIPAGQAPAEKKEGEAAEGEVIVREEPPAGTNAAETVIARHDDAAEKKPARKVNARQSVLERFRDHRGERTVRGFLALFEQDDQKGFRQDPSVALTDGSATVKVIFDLPGAGKGSPQYALQGARFISLTRNGDRESRWVIEARPDKGVYAAGVAVSGEAVVEEFPLALAPKADADLDGSGAVTKKDFALFLKRKGVDLNGDGKRDYLDDYIFTANYIVATGKHGPGKGRP